MRRLLSLIPLALFTLVLGIAPAAASPPDVAEGDWTYVVDLAGLTTREAGNTVFITGTEVSTFTGTFVGTADDTFVVTCHQKGPDTTMNFANGTIEFTGAVDGRVGTMTMKFTGKQESTSCLPSGAIWSGRWTIIGGTGELAELHGNGTWTGPSFDLDYTGRIHFD